MQKLKCLNLRNLSERSLRILAQNRITTILDFLQEDVSKLSALTKLSLSDILTIRNEIFTKFSAPLINGTDLFNKVFKTRSRISTGIERYAMRLSIITYLKLTYHRLLPKEEKKIYISPTNF